MQKESSVILAEPVHHPLHDGAYFSVLPSRSVVQMRRLAEGFVKLAYKEYSKYGDFTRIGRHRRKYPVLVLSMSRYGLASLPLARQASTSSTKLRIDFTIFCYDRTKIRCNC